MYAKPFTTSRKNIGGDDFVRRCAARRLPGTDPAVFGQFAATEAARGRLRGFDYRRCSVSGDGLPIRIGGRDKVAAKTAADEKPKRDGRWRL